MLGIAYHGGPYGGGKYRKNGFIHHTALGFTAPTSKGMPSSGPSVGVKAMEVTAAGEMFLVVGNKITKYNDSGAQVATISPGTALTGAFWDENTQTLFVTSGSSGTSIFSYDSNLVAKGTGYVMAGDVLYDIYGRGGVLYALGSKLHKLTFNGTTFSLVSSGPLANSKTGEHNAASSIVVTSTGDIYVSVDSVGGGYPVLQKYNNSLVYQHQFSAARVDILQLDAQDKLYHGGSKYNIGASITTNWTWNSQGYSMHVHDATDAVFAFTYLTGLVKLNKAGALQWTAADLPSAIISGNYNAQVQAVYNPVAKNVFLFSSSGDAHLRMILENYKIYA
jgi:hypothetical protein